MECLSAILVQFNSFTQYLTTRTTRRWTEQESTTLLTELLVYGDRMKRPGRSKEECFDHLDALLRPYYRRREGAIKSYHEQHPETSIENLRATMTSPQEDDFVVHLQILRYMVCDGRDLRDSIREAVRVLHCSAS